MAFKLLRRVSEFSARCSLSDCTNTRHHSFDSTFIHAFLTGSIEQLCLGDDEHSGEGDIRGVTATIPTRSV